MRLWPRRMPAPKALFGETHSPATAFAFPEKLATRSQTKIGALKIGTKIAATSASLATSGEWRGLWIMFVSRNWQGIRPSRITISPAHELRPPYKREGRNSQFLGLE